MATAMPQTMARWTPEVNARGDEQRQPPVDGDRGCDVAGGKARVGWQVVEPGNVGALAVDEEDRRSVGGRLERDAEEGEHRGAPVPADREADREQDDEDRQHDAARDLRSEERERR